MAEQLCMGCMNKFDENESVCPYCGYKVDTPPAEPYHLAPGVILGGKYIVGKTIGYGGFSVTYLAYDYSLDKKIAIKEYLPSEFATRAVGSSTVSIFSGDRTDQFNGGIEKFIDEAKRLAKFKGTTGITDVYDVFRENNTAYIDMEYLEGQTLKEFLLDNGKINYQKAVDMMIPIIRTLKKVHEKGILHRDIAPDNIFITSNGEVKLIDFGAARQATSTNHSKSLSVIVKPGYAPPEQYRSRGEQGPWTDVYGCGATLYKMITGVTPDDSMERCSKDTLELPSRFATDISENVENAILNALNIEIDDRTPDMERLEYELTTTDVVHKNRVTSKSRDLGRWPIWLKAVISASILAVLAVGTLLVTGVINWDSLISSDDRSDARVPNVINLTVDDAEKILASENIDMKIVDKQESEDIPKDSVLSQNISGGSQVQKGMTVEIVVSSGKGQVYMPDFTGIGQTEAVEQVEKMGLHAKIETQESEIAQDYICDQQYKEGEKVDKGSEILLKVSIGNSGYDESAETTIPDVVGETWENARKCAREKKIYIYKEETINDSKVAQGSVIKQNRKSGEKEKQGFALGVKVSLGVKMTHVPDVVYKSLEDARILMDESNLRIEVEYEQSDKVEKDHVISQSIKPDTEVEEKTIIKLVVSKGNGSEDNSEATSDTEETTEMTTEDAPTTAQETTTEEETTEMTTEDTPTTAQETTTEEETTESPEPDDEPTKAIVPDLSGCSEDSAISMLYDAGLSVGSIEYRSDPNSYDGAVLSQGVSAYSEVDYGTSVSLIICNNEKDESGNYICPEY